MSLYKVEKQMYPHVCTWFKKLLKEKFKNMEICVEDTSEKVLSKWLVEKGYHKFFSDYQTYEIEVDVTGIVKISNEKALLGLIECKLGRITYYSAKRHIIIGKWNERRRELNFSGIIPRGSRIFDTNL